MWFGVLGPLEVRDDEGAPIAVPGPARRQVLAALLHRAGRKVGAAALVDDLWGDAPPRSALKTLQSHIVRLRDDLGRGQSGDLLVTDGDGYRLVVGPDDVDAVRFERLCDIARRAQRAGDDERALALLEPALALWRDEAYLDFGEAPFAVSERIRLGELRTLAREARTDLAMARGSAAELVPELLQRVDEQPFRERGWEQLVLAYYRAGRQADALAALSRVRCLLSQELGIDPMPALRELEARILRQDADLLLVRPRPVVVGSPGRARCPYLGLAAYGEREAAIFVGREKLTSQVTGRLAEHSVVVVTGASGVGKSSLVRAGVVPALRRGALPGSAAWRILVSTPTEGVADAALDGCDFLVLDQAEELFTALTEDERGRWISRLQGYRRSDGRLLLVLRGDCFGRLAAVQEFAGSAGQATVLVGPMRTDELRRALVEPAAAAGLRLEPELVETVLEEAAGQLEPLPQLSQALVRTWEQRSGDVLTLAGYQRAGGLAGALEAAGEEAYSALSPAARQAARHLLVRLAVRSGEDWVRRPLPRAELPAQDEATEEALERLVSARLVQVGERVEVAHDALLRHWPRLRGWLEERALAAETLDRLRAATVAWQQAGRHPADLYRGPRLDAALEWTTAHPGDITVQEREFLEASAAAARSELATARAQLRREARARRRTRVVAIALACAVGLATVGAGAAVYQAAQARRAALSADARRLAAMALTAPDLQTSSLLAVAGYRLQDTPDTRSALMSVLQRGNSALVRVPLPQRLLREAASTDGRRLFVLDDRRDISVVDPVTATVVGRFPARADLLDAVTGDGGLVVSGPAPDTSSDPGQVAVLDGSTGAVRGTVPVASDDRGPPPTVTADGRRIAVVVAADAQAGGVGSTVDIFDTQDLRAPPAVVRMPATVTGVAAARGRIAMLAADGTLEIVNPATGTVLGAAVHPELAGTQPGAPYRAMAMSPDGASLAVAADAVRTYDGATLQGGTAISQAPEVTSLAWSADGKLLALTDHGGEVAVFDAASGRPTAALAGHAGPALGAAWVPTAQGPALFTIGLDHDLIRWDLSGDARLVRRGPWLGVRPDTAERFGDVVVGVTPRQDGTSPASTERLFRLDLRSGHQDSWPLDLQDGDSVDETIAGRDGRLGLVTVQPAAGPTRLELWDLAAGRRLRDLVLPPDADRSLILDGTLSAGGETAVVALAADRVGLFSTATGRLFREIPVRFTGGAVNRLSVLPWQPDPGGRILVVGADSGPPAPPPAAAGGATSDASDQPPANQRLALLDLRTGHLVAQVGLGPDKATAVGWSADGRLLALGTFDGRLRLHDARTLAVVADAGTVHNGPVTSVGFAPDGSTLVTGGSDGMDLWSAPGLLREGSPFGTAGSSSWYAWFGPGQQIEGLAPSGDPAAPGEVWFTMPGTPAGWAQAACRLTVADMSRDQWRRYVGTRPYQAVCPH